MVQVQGISRIGQMLGSGLGVSPVYVQSRQIELLKTKRDECQLTARNAFKE